MVNFNTKKWKPIRQGPLQHSIGGKKLYYLKFNGDFEVDNIREFAQRKSNALFDGEAKTKSIQVSVIYSNEHDRSGKMTAIGAEVDVKDLRNMYKYDLGGITGFYVYLI